MQPGYDDNYRSYEHSVSRATKAKQNSQPKPYTSSRWNSLAAHRVSFSWRQLDNRPPTQRELSSARLGHIFHCGLWVFIQLDAAYSGVSVGRRKPGVIEDEKVEPFHIRIDQLLHTLEGCLNVPRLYEAIFAPFSYNNPIWWWTKV